MRIMSDEGAIRGNLGAPCGVSMSPRPGADARTDQHHAHHPPERRDPGARRPHPDPALPASADGIGVSDPQDLDHGVDLRSVKVEHGRATSWSPRPTPTCVESFRSGSSGSVFIDTDPADTGPEYVFAGGFFVGTDYALLRTDGFADSRGASRSRAPTG